LPFSKNYGISIGITIWLVLLKEQLYIIFIVERTVLQFNNLQMKNVLFLVLLVSVTGRAQVVVDSFPNAVTSSKLFNTSDVCQGVMSNGHPYVLCWNVAYPAANFPVQFVRADLVTKKITTIRIDSKEYYTGQIWAMCYDSSGMLYMSSYYGKGTGHLYQLNLKDAEKIGLKDLGVPFGGRLIYSLSLGRDNKMYFGTEGDSQIGYYDPQTDITKTYPALDIYQNYVLGIAGDSDWIYSQIGQKDSIFIYATRKSDGAKFKLSSNPNSTRYDLKALKGFCSMRQNFGSYGNPAGFYYLYNGAMHSKPPASATNTNAGAPIQYEELYKIPTIGHYYANTIYDAVTNYLFYTHGFGKDAPTVDSVQVPCDSVLLAAGGPLFTFNDTTIYYRAPIQYGDVYAYNMVTHVNKHIGRQTSNIYAVLVDKNNKGVYMGGYPSGSLMYYNPAEQWTENKIIHGSNIALSKTSNPQLLTYFRTESKPPAGFHHTYSIGYDKTGSLIVCSGDIIRTQKSIGIGAYDIKKDSAYGNDFGSRDGLTYEGAPVPYKKWMLFPSGSELINGTTPHIYFYDALKNIYADSMTIPGFTHYGNIFVVGDTLYGFNKTTGYKINLRTKQVMDTFTYTSGSPSIFMLHSGQMVTNLTIPKTFYPNVVAMPNYNIMCEHNGILYGTNKKGQLVRIRSL